MSWPLVFIRFFLASTTRVEDTGPEYDQLLCRMFGDSNKEGCTKAIAQAGCGCPVQLETLPFTPSWSGTGFKVGWEETFDESAAITFSFEKEWKGKPPRLHELYGPAGVDCERIWRTLEADHEREKFMAMFRDNSYHPALSKYQHPGLCSLTQRGNQKHRWLPLRRSSGVPRGISELIEDDAGPWEIKAATFYYELGEMSKDLSVVLPRLNAPGFPAERRIQVHIVAPLRKTVVHSDVNGVPPFQNKLMRRNFRLIELYFSDFVLLRLGFPSGPKGEKCKSREGEPFGCDILSDTYNRMINQIDALSAASDNQDEFITDHKGHIVSIRGDQAYGGSEDFYRVGFEIRKSESYGMAVKTAEAIAYAISTMQADGTARVGVTVMRDIASVRQFAQDHRMRLLDGTPNDFCYEETQNEEYRGHWHATVLRLSDYLYEDIGQRSRSGALDPTKQETKYKLWTILTLVLCSDWPALLGHEVKTTVPREQMLLAFNEFHATSATPEGTATIHKMVAQYSFDISENF